MNAYRDNEFKLGKLFDLVEGHHRGAISLLTRYFPPALLFRRAVQAGEGEITYRGARCPIKKVEFDGEWSAPYLPCLCEMSNKDLPNGKREWKYTAIPGKFTNLYPEMLGLPEDSEGSYRNPTLISKIITRTAEDLVSEGFRIRRVWAQVRKVTLEKAKKKASYHDQLRNYLLNLDQMDQSKEIASSMPFITDETWIRLRARALALLPEAGTPEQDSLALTWLLLGALLKEQVSPLLDRYQADFKPVGAEAAHPEPLFPYDAVMRADPAIQDPAIYRPISASGDQEHDQFVFRQKLEAAIQAPMRAEGGRPVIFLTGGSGSGKTELARSIATQHSQAEGPAHVFWMVYHERYDLAAHDVDAFRTKSLRTLLRENELQQEPEDFMALTRQDLIVIDNLDYEDQPLLRDLLGRTGQAVLLITTRKHTPFEDFDRLFHERNAERVLIPADADREDRLDTAAAVFGNCYYKDIGDTADTVERICAHLGCNLDFVHYLAKSTTLQPDQIYASLRDSGLLSFAHSERQAVAHNSTTLSDFEELTDFVYRDLLQEKSFSTLEAQCLALLALVPGTYQDRSFVEDLLGDGETTGRLARNALDALVDRAVLDQTRDESRVLLNPFLAEVLLKKQPAVARLWKDGEFLGKVLENWLTAQDDAGALPALVQAVLERTYPLEDCWRQQLALQMTYGLGDELLRRHMPELPGAVLACVDARDERRFVLWALAPKAEDGREHEILTARRGYAFQPEGRRHAAARGGRVRRLRLYARKDLETRLVLYLPDRIGGAPITEIPDYFCWVDPLLSELYFGQYPMASLPKLKVQIDRKVNCFYSLRLPEPVERIGVSAFTALRVKPGTTLYLPSHLREIGDRAFATVFFSGELILPEALETIGFRAFFRTRFKGALLLTDKPNLKQIASMAFERCPYLTPPSQEEIRLLTERKVDIAEDAFSKANSPKSQDYYLLECSPAEEGRMIKSFHRGSSKKYSEKDIQVILQKIDEALTGYCVFQQEMDLEGTPMIRFDSERTSLNSQDIQSKMLFGSMELPPRLKEIDRRTFFRQYDIFGDLTIPKSMFWVGPEAFAESGLDGTVTIEGTPMLLPLAFARTGIHTVVFLDGNLSMAPDVFEDCDVTFVAPADSAAASYAREHQIPLIDL